MVEVLRREGRAQEPRNLPPYAATQPAERDWSDRPEGFRRHESTVVLGRGDDLWSHAVHEVMRWGIKTASGFSVVGDPRVQEGRDYTVLAHLGLITITEPVRVVAVVESPDRCGFAYATRPGHPVRGEEAFIVHRAPDGTVSLTLRSLTASSDGGWRLAFPLALVAQRWYRRRYRRALV